MLVEERGGFVILAGVEIGAAEDEKDEIVLRRTFGCLFVLDDVTRDLDTDLVFPVEEQGGEHHLLDIRLVFGLRESGEEQFAIFLRSHDIADYRGSANQVEKVVFALLGLGEKLLKLEIGRVGAVDVAVCIMDERDHGELEHFDGLVAALLGLKGGELGLEARLVKAEGAGGKARKMAHVADAGAQIIDGDLCGRNELIKVERRFRHLGLKGVGGELHEGLRIALHRVGGDDQAAAVLGDEIEKRALVGLCDGCGDQRLEPGHDGFVRRGEGVLVRDCNFKMLTTLGDLTEAIMGDRHVHME